MRALLCLMLLGSLAAQNLRDELSQPPKAKTEFKLFYEDIDGYTHLCKTARRTYKSRRRTYVWMIQL